MFANQLWNTIDTRSSEIAIEAPEATLTYGDLGRKIRRVGSELRRRGLRGGDRVILYLDDKLGLLISHLGVVMAGGVSLPLNPRFTRFEMTYFLRDSGARFAVSTDDQAELLRQLQPEATALEAVLPPEALSEHDDVDQVEPEIAPQDAAFILYSSGTTGEPKGVVHTHRNLGCALDALRSCWRFTPHDVLLNTLPLFHIHGLSFASHLVLTTGSRMIINHTFHPLKTLDEIPRATVFYGIPPFYYAFLGRSEFREKAAGWGGVRLFTCGSAPIRPEVLPELEEILGRPVINRYGMTESHVITSLPLDRPSRQGSVGFVLDGLEMKLVDEQRAPVPVGTVGEVTIRGRNLFDRYWQRPELTRRAFDSDSWFGTGDLGCLDEDGYLTLRGRRKDLIIVNGYNVYPPIVERAINSHPAVSESAVVGVPDPRRGERAVAFVVATDSSLDPEEIKSFCNERIVDYERPWKVYMVDSLPRNTMGKVLKTELRRIAQGDE